MPSTPTLAPSIDDPAELAYLHHRKVVRRRQLAAILAIMILVIGFVGWKVARHLSTAWWLEANQYVVIWSVDQDNWKQGGSTVVRYTSIQNRIFASERPVIDLRFLSSLHRIDELSLSTLMGVRDSDLTNLDQMRDLRNLHLDRGNQPDWMTTRSKGITDVTLEKIGRLSRLEEVYLGSQSVTDVGIKNLVGLDRLKTVDLEGTLITDASLEYLRRIPSLKSLDLMHTQVTARGVAKFEAARPDVKVQADPPQEPLVPKILR